MRKIQPCRLTALDAHFIKASPAVWASSVSEGFGSRAARKELGLGTRAGAGEANHVKGGVTTSVEAKTKDGKNIKMQQLKYTSVVDLGGLKRGGQNSH